MTPGHAVDGKLASWQDIQAAHHWGTLLFGNGLSINVWPGFSYTSLHERALAERDSGGLSEDDARLFAALGGTTNFERVLGELRAAIQVTRACEHDAAVFEERYRSIQRSLAVAVRAAHVRRGAIPARTLSEIRAQLSAYDNVFTTNYDLLAYWAMGYGDTFAGFCDCFWSNGRNEFDAAKTAIPHGTTPVFFLHGALHLIVGGDGRTRKLTRRRAMLLHQVGRPIPDDPGARPLLVTEGSSRDKLLTIQANDYLRFTLDALRRCNQPLVVFGHSLSSQDQHLIDALNLSPQRPVAESIVPDRPQRVRARQGEIRAVLDTHELYFYDSTTHPLGAAHLRTPISHTARLHPPGRRAPRAAAAAPHQTRLLV